MSQWIVTIIIIAVLAGIVYAYNNPAIMEKVKNINLPTVSIGTTSIGEFMDNPEDYLNKEVTVVGSLSENRNTYGIVGYLIEEKDNQGYQYSFPLKAFEEKYREISTYSRVKYKIKGIIKDFEVCDVEIKYTDINQSCVNVVKNWEWISRDFEVLGIYNNQNITVTKVEGDFWSAYSHIQELTKEWTKTGNGLASEYDGKKEYFNCTYYVQPVELCNYKGTYRSCTLKPPLGPEVKIDGEYMKEYRCKPNTTTKIYYIEGTEPMVKIS